MFSSQRTWTSLFDGQVLLGEVQRFMRQTGAPPGAVDLLATIAALGSVSLADLPAVGTVLGLDQATMRTSLERSAHAGLVDVARRYDGERTYQVRPEMLADVLVADRAFRADVPPFTLSSLIETWPDRTPDLARIAINSVRLSALEARPAASGLMLRLQETRASTGELERRYAMLDEQAARDILGWIQERFTPLQAAGRLAHGIFEDEIETCAVIARTYQIPHAVRLLLDAALIYTGPTNRSVDPLSRLEEIIRHFHPELVATSERLRRVLVNELDAWIADRQEDRRAWRVYADTLKAVLALRKSTVIASAADPNQFTLYEGLIAETEIGALYQEVWPPILTRLSQAPVTVVKAAIGVAADWLRVGSGHDLALGKLHPQPTIDAARSAGTLLTRDLEPLAAQDAGLTALLQREAARHGIAAGISVDEGIAAFFTAIDRADINASARRLSEDIAQVVEEWDREDPQQVAARLAGINSSLRLAGISWPDRIQIACDHLARSELRLAEWIDASLEFELFPSSAPFVYALIERGGTLPPSALHKAFCTPGARASVLTALLATAPDERHIELAARNLTGEDGPLLDALAAQRLPAQRQHVVLTRAAAPARGRFALALFAMTNDTGAWPPTEIAEPWRRAITDLDLRACGQEDRYDLERLFDYLALHEPQIAQGFARATLRHIAETRGTAQYGPLTERLHLLRSTFKTAVLTDPNYRTIRPLLVSWLIGRDAAWAAEMLQTGTLTPGDVLTSRGGFSDDELSIPQLSELLIPYGVDPVRIAAQAQFGLYRGEESAHFHALTTQFADYAESDNPNVALVGRSGVGLFTERHAQAQAAEQRAHVYDQ